MESDWSKLPLELLEMISDRLATLTDHVRFRAVCRSWADTPPPPRQLRQMPWLLLPHKLNTETRTFLDVSNNEFFCFSSPEFRGRTCRGSSHGWLALVNGTPDISLYSPLTCEKILLPKLTELPEAQRFRESQEDDPDQVWDIKFMRNLSVHRVVLSGNPGSRRQDCWAALGYNKTQDTVAFCRLGEKSWMEIEEKPSDDNEDRDYTDLIFHNGLLYVLDSTGRIIICDPNSPQQLTEVHPKGLYNTRCTRLAEMGESLLLLRAFLMEDEEGEGGGDRGIKYDARVLSLAVFKFDRRELVKINDLGNYAIFFDAYYRASELADEIPGCRKNCIYFPVRFEVEKGVYAKNGYELSSFSLENSSIEPIVSLVLQVHDHHHEDMQAVWYTPNFVMNWKASSSSSSAAAKSNIWIPNAKGIFSIKLCHPVDLQARYSFPGPIEPKKWRELRDANLPAKLRLMLWTVACGVVPDKLFGKNQLKDFPDSYCPLCHQVEESLEHLLLFCQYTRVAWLYSPWPLRYLASEDTKISSWVNSILDVADTLGLGSLEAMRFLLFAAVFIEQIWIIRNCAATGKAIPHPMIFASQLRKIHRDYLIGRFHKRAMSLLGYQWLSPDAGETKVNFDVAICRDFMMLGMTYRDHDGRFLLAWTERIPTCEAIVAEAKAAFLAISIAIKSGFSKLVLEGNAPSVINPLKHSDIPPCRGIASLIDDIKALLASLEVWWVRSVTVKENIAAHNLACWAAFYCRTGLIQVPSLPACVLYSHDMYHRPASNFPKKEQYQLHKPIDRYLEFEDNPADLFFLLDDSFENICFNFLFVPVTTIGIGRCFWR